MVDLDHFFGKKAEKLYFSVLSAIKRNVVQIAASHETAKEKERKKSQNEKI